jgi:hypothetical protein
MGKSIACPRKNCINDPNLKSQIILERSQGTAPCLSSGGGCISIDTYSASRLGKDIIKESNSHTKFPLV